MESDVCVYGLEHKTCDILAAEPERFDNWLITDSFQSAVNVLKWYFSINTATHQEPCKWLSYNNHPWLSMMKKEIVLCFSRKGIQAFLWHKTMRIQNNFDKSWVLFEKTVPINCDFVDKPSIDQLIAIFVAAEQVRLIANTINWRLLSWQRFMH